MLEPGNVVELAADTGFDSAEHLLVKLICLILKRAAADARGLAVS